MNIHLVRVPQDVDVVNVRWKPAKWGERLAFFSVHVDSYMRRVSEEYEIVIIVVPIRSYHFSDDCDGGGGDDDDDTQTTTTNKQANKQQQ